MTEEWKQNAIKEQEEVFDDLKFLNNCIDKNDIKKLVTIITKQHLRYKFTNDNSVEFGKISELLLENVPSDQEKVTLTFAVIVLDKKIDGKLCKIPVFSLLSDTQCIFIDINCTLFESWPSFVENNDLPSGQYCFPINGVYNREGILEVHFGNAFGPSKWARRIRNVVGFLTTCATVASTYFFKIPQTIFNAAARLAEVAARYLPDWLCECGEYVGMLARNVVSFCQAGAMSIAQFMMWTAQSLLGLITSFKNIAVDIWTGVGNALRAMYCCVRAKFAKWFLKAPAESQQLFVATANKVDGELCEIDAQFDKEITTEVTTENKNAEIFEDCKKECALQKQEKVLCGKTIDLAAIGSTVAEYLKAETLDEAKDLFLSVTAVIKSEYKKRIELYLSMAKVMKNSKTQSSLKSLNVNLGIVGNPKDHYWKEALEDAQSAVFHSLIKQKLKEIKMEKSILMVNLWKETENSVNGLYKITGVEGTGKISATKLKKLLTKQSIDLNKYIAVNRTDSLTMIRSKNMIVILAQEVDEVTNTADGLIFIQKD